MEENIETQTKNELNTEKQPFNVGEIKVTEKYLEKFTDSTAYKVKLENFEGPLDLLLYLIKDSKLDIATVRLAEVTEQYLSYMTQLSSVDMEMAAEFIEVAATLVEIKSKAMIPQEKEAMENEDDKETNLLQRLKEYKLFKEASEKMKTLENVNRLYKMPDETVNDFRVVLKQMTMDSLINAFTNLMSKVNIREVAEEERTIEKDRFTVDEKMFEIKTLLINVDKVSFNALVDNGYTRSEIITSFMAMLELLKLQVIAVEQTEMYGEIEILKGENYNG